MVEVRFHGLEMESVMGASEMLAYAAVKDGLYSAVIPEADGGKGSASFAVLCVISSSPIEPAHSRGPDHVVVLDQSLLDRTDVLRGMKRGGTVLVNTTKEFTELGLETRNRIVTVDASRIMVRKGLVMRSAEVVTAAMLGALARVCTDVSLDAILESIREHTIGKREESVAAAEDAYNVWGFL